MSFNIRYDNPNDGINAWANRKALVYSFLKEATPDIIGFQEVMKHQLDDIQINLEQYHYVGAGRDDGKEKGEFTPVFYLKNKYELLASSYFWLSETPEIPGSVSWGATYPRIVSWVQLKDIQQGYIFYVFNTHFSHMSSYARNESTILLLKKMNTIASGAPLILTGDFNAQPNERMYTTMTENWQDFDQLWDSRELPLDNKPVSIQTYNGFNDETPEVVIDHIFVNGFFDAKHFNTYKVKEDGIYISDHYPIMADLSFRLNQREAQGAVKKLKQNTPAPLIEPQPLCFYDSSKVQISSQGSNTNIYYTLNGEIPDTSSALYNKAITIKNSGQLKARAFQHNMYPSATVSQQYIKKIPTKARLIEVIPQPDEQYFSGSYAALFDGQQGSIDQFNDKYWIGFNGTDNDFLFDFKQRSNIREVYLSCLSHPAKWVATPSMIEISISNDGITYKKIHTASYQASFDESQSQHHLLHMPFKARARYLKISVYNAGLLPATHSAKGNPSWLLIDELVVQ
ncbi:endonuclease/exonuclease/phosphatase family protein [Carboxylicivirga sp. M1479]|uniref:endonuclease/exonuclease/phosphatase family protein n=1 Tax=Carboxylicivirga sp. M1479 TaxID=2594476 RepID=UPI00163D4D9B|nr:endonuclease/exonuclease/phosphatase family protein [Carboxylicivirga sp. M1479]